MESKVTNKKTEYKGKFLEFKTIDYVDKNGDNQKWETIERANNINAVSIIPILKPSNKYVIIKQYRPTVDKYVLTFPAGLIDKGESIKDSALRELKEETGYVGEIIKEIPPTLSSAGMTNELVSTVICHIEEKENINPEQDLENSEEIEVVLVRENDITEFIKEELNKGSTLSGRFASYFLGKDLI